MTDSAVRMVAVQKSYPHFQLSDIELDLPEGQIMGLIGANGAGKSTTIRILLGLVHQDEGEVEMLGFAIPGQQVEAKRDVGYVSEDMSLYGRATLGWHMNFVKSIYPAWDQSFADDLAHRFDLRTDQKIRGMSHGQGVKSSLLLSLARRPKLLILDEPTTGLDPVARYEVLSQLMDVVADEGRSVLFSSHNTADVEQISDKIVFIDRGKIIDSRDKETFLDNWRRLRLEMPADTELPELPGVVQQQKSGRLGTITTNQYTPELQQQCRESGAQIHEVENMTLEEIFVAIVMNSRGDSVS